MYIFLKGYDGCLWYRIWSWSSYYWTGNWVSLGGQLSSSPAAVSRYSNNINVYVRGTNGAVYENQYNYGTWSGFYSLGGQVAPNTGPATSGWAGREDVFVQGTNGALYQKTWTGATGWSSWINLGGKLTSSPAAVSRQAGDLDVFGRGTNGASYAKHFWGGSWSGWINIGGQVAPNTGPAVCSWGATREDVFVQGTNGALYQKTWSAATGWTTSWINLGGGLTSSPAAVAKTYYDGQIDIQVFARGADGALWDQAYYSGAWHGWLGPYQGPP